jgi:hypothetical protein
MRMSRSGLPDRGGRFAALGLLVLVLGPVGLALVILLGGGRPVSAQVSLFDPRLDEVRRASVLWDRRRGPDREVVDVVCLVPDLATFLEVVATWDERHYFPVLIDDVEYTFKFLRAFRPARIVRYPRTAAAVAPEQIWEKAVEAVGKAWGSDGIAAGALPRGDAVPRSLGPVPPAVVVSTPQSPSLAGAVALAAGRFQPLLKWEITPKRPDKDLSLDEARALAINLESLLADLFPKYDQLGDDCDFVTLAADYPYRYEGSGGVCAVDDLILRAAHGQRRWAYCGRLVGDTTSSVYRAMCSLFLTPSSALLFNCYDEKERPWSDYGMSAAAAALNLHLPVTHRNGERADRTGWHQVFDPSNRFGLVLINSSGGPNDFNIPKGGGVTADIPETGPVAVLIIHSFSAVNPFDPSTLAGRWLANGAFVYFGAMNEPYLQGFRTPSLVATFLTENLPVVTAVRRSATEVYGQPWRLVFFGDPLFRIKPVAGNEARLASWKTIDAWPSYGEFRQPEADAPESVRLNWVLKTAIFRFQSGASARQRVDLPATLLGIGRDRLEPASRPLFDDLLIDTLVHANRSAELLDRLTRVPLDERTASLARHLETAQMAALQRAVATRDFRLAIALWIDVIRTPGAEALARTFTDRVGAMAEGPVRLANWRTRLVSSLRAPDKVAHGPIIEAEIKRVDEKLKTANATR